MLVYVHVLQECIGLEFGMKSRIEVYRGYICSRDRQKGKFYSVIASKSSIPIFSLQLLPSTQNIITVVKGSERVLVRFFLGGIL